MSDDSEDSRQGLYGFSLQDWVAAGEFPSVEMARGWLDSSTPPETFTTEGWLRIARLSPEHARRAWGLVGAHWEAWAAARWARSREGDDESRRADFAEWATILDAHIAELRRLMESPTRGAD